MVEEFVGTMMEGTRLARLLEMLMRESRLSEAREYLLDLRLATEERKRSCSSTDTREGPGTGGSGRVGGPVGGGFIGEGMCEGGVGNASRSTR